MLFSTAQEHWFILPSKIPLNSHLWNRRYIWEYIFYSEDKTYFFGGVRKWIKIYIWLQLCWFQQYFLAIIFSPFNLLIKVEWGVGAKNEWPTYNSTSSFLEPVQTFLTYKLEWQASIYFEDRIQYNLLFSWSSASFHRHLSCGVTWLHGFPCSFEKWSARTDNNLTGWPSIE